MKNNRILLPFLSLIVLILLAHLFNQTPISISFGRNGKPVESVYNDILQPGLYFISFDKPVRLPDGINVFPSNAEAVQKYCGGVFGTGLKHNGKREGDKNKMCENGPIETSILDDYKIKYKCIKCGKTWIVNINESK